ncbi:TolC family protein [Sinomicrobium weinanense]|uniref:TolC family protein n=1 Tax=Sinomicrobium weinanense TaxID=2842200 RepID=A0A926JUS6_9FLAO|nr:TolC family protein [Sinomicrobium weinanense]MBC9797613.1 TolC family protein [Sinomicrobium weinanense]MBU3123435.1 TolC family protein [Sinomicrobium weinanense]
MRCLIHVLTVLCIGLFRAGAQDTLVLNRKQCEAILLENNLQLLAQRLKIDEAEARLLQAGLWPNPELSIDEVNLWTTGKGTNNLNYFGDGLPPLSGNSWKNQQISVELEQLVQTAGKRKKLMALEQVSVDMAGQYLEELLRNLKREFRNDLTELQYLQQYKRIYEQEASSVRQLVQAYQKQVEQGNTGKGEYIRLKALELEISGELNRIAREANAVQKELKVLMRLPADTVLVLKEDDFIPGQEKIRGLFPDHLLEAAMDNHPGLKLAQLEKTYSDRSYNYEKAMKVPDVTFKAGYDRGGNFMLDFIGFGLAVDLPVFDRNQGNIKAARIGQERARLQYEQKELEVEADVMLAYRDLMTALSFMESIDTDYGNELGKLLDSYTRNFRERNISMLEYLDFLETYLHNRNIMLESVKTVNGKLEELQYEIGKDITQIRE